MPQHVSATRLPVVMGRLALLVLSAILLFGAPS
jgi:hypothetical protein